MKIAKYETCPKCKMAANHTLHKQPKSNGGYHLLFTCDLCGGGGHASGGGKWVGKEVLEKYRATYEDVPTHNVELQNVDCAVCGTPYAELHHFAPVGIFGSDAEKWPKAFLCREHHMQWHKAVTPNLFYR